MHAELTNPTRDRLKQVIFITIAVSTVAYMFFGIAGYLWAGNQTQVPVDDGDVVVVGGGIKEVVVDNRFWW
jgi:amino acid permease